MSGAKASRASPPFLMSLPQWVTPQPAGEGLFSTCTWEEGELELAVVQSAAAEMCGWAVLASVKGVLLLLAGAATSIFLWRQKFYFCRNKTHLLSRVCHDINNPVAAPTNHSLYSVKSLGKVLSTVKPKPFFIRDASQVLLYIVL